MNSVSKKIQLGIGSLLIAGAVAAGTPFSVNAGAPGCPGDLNGDGRVTISDQMLARTRFGSPKQDGTPFTITDYMVVIRAYGTTC